VQPDDPPPSLDRTVADTDRTAPSGEVDQSVPPHDAALPSYRLERRIGLGGMGEVLLARDEQLGRDVAIKRLRTATPTPQALARFLREARIQARLDHPAIVPVHELGEDTTGQPYFTMKRLAGRTLAEVTKADDKPPLNQLLRVFADVCLAVDFAHARGVVHRDLKPGNVMLGDFGEVYIIDWGVARVLDEVEEEVEEEAAETDAAAAAAAAAVAVDPAITAPKLVGVTEAGAVLGTPGYIAPEQIANASEATAAADVYSLGATLFELLAGERLHPRGAEGLVSALGDVDGSPARRRPELAIAPELDALCVRAVATDPVARPTARELARGVQAYLDGDRDLERRRELAAAELARAQALLDAADPRRRPEAVRAAGRALALDPESRDAAALITKLMLEPPSDPPPELARYLTRSELALQQRQGRVAVRSLFAILAFLAATAASGLRDPVALGGIAAWTVLVIGIAFTVSRRPARAGEMWVIAVANVLLGAMLSRLFGPLVITPVVSCIMAVSLTSYPELMRHTRVVLSLLVVAWLGPVVLEYAGVLRPTWGVAGGMVISTSRVVAVSETATSAILIGANTLAIVVIGSFANALARARRDAQRQVEIQAWHLRQLLPT
jgi:eukaryotic-like serine/threonine-protein kinase